MKFVLKRCKQSNPRSMFTIFEVCVVTYKKGHSAEFGTVNVFRFESDSVKAICFIRAKVTIIVVIGWNNWLCIIGIQPVNATFLKMNFWNDEESFWYIRRMLFPRKLWMSVCFALQCLSCFLRLFFSERLIKGLFRTLSNIYGQVFSAKIVSDWK